MSTNSLTWALVIATYQREQILPRCLRLAAGQTRPPQEVIVVDASSYWEETRQTVAQEFANSFPTIPLTYVKATCPSSSAQRNQGIDLASADVLFLIDDDSLMYPDCAEEILKVYETDTEAAIKGVSAIAMPAPPDVAGSNVSPEMNVTCIDKPKQTALRRFMKSLLATDQSFFLPYDSEYPTCPVPEQLRDCGVGRIQVMAGFAMTFRRSILQQERFSEVLNRYAAGEDQDLSYRVSRHGAIVNAPRAKLCHLEVSGGRPNRFRFSVLESLNPAVLQQFYSTNRDRTNREWRKILLHRLLINFLKDLADKEWTLSTTRGVLAALLQLRKIYSRSPEELCNWYPMFQAKLAGEAVPVPSRPFGINLSHRVLTLTKKGIPEIAAVSFAKVSKLR